MDLDRAITLELYDRPLICKACSGIMLFKGVGEYQCEDCNSIEYDEYGRVRLYLEKHPGATITQISVATGVSQKNIRMMIKEARFEITAASKSFLTCERCKASIRSGRFCSDCEVVIHRETETRKRNEIRDNLKDKSGHLNGPNVEKKGEKRFVR